MPPKKIFFKYSEEDLSMALGEIDDGCAIRSTARKYGIPHSTLINKIKLRHPVQRKMGPPTILTSQEEDLLCDWITTMAKKGFSLTKENILQTVTDIVIEDGRTTPFKDNTPGKKWFTCFLKRHKEISQRYAETVNIARSHVTESAIRKWHSDLYDYLSSEGVLDILEDPDRILNADESGFLTNPSSGLIVESKGFNHLYSVKDKEKENITVLGTFTASGKIIPPLIIYPYERILTEITKHVNINWSIGRSSNGWMTSRVFYGYIANTLIPKLKEENIKFPVLFLIDGHKSHINYEVSKLCIENQIILYALYPNATHILEPADVSIFRPLKVSSNKVVQNWELKTEHRILTGALFAPLFEEALKAVPSTVITNGFKRCGIYPFNADAIDYNKCMDATSRRNTHTQNKPEEIQPEHLLFFETLMPANRVEEFHNLKEDEQWQGDESARELFYVWRKIKTGMNNSTTPIETITTQNEENTTNMPQVESNTVSLILNSSTEPATGASGSHISPTESPRQNKRTSNKVRLPDAVSSTEWMNYYFLLNNYF